MAFLPNFPFLDQQEFKQICEDFVASFKEGGTEQGEWSHVNHIIVGECSFIRIIRSRPVLSTQNKLSSESVEIRDEDDMFDEVDEEALPRQMTSTIEVEYDILLSPSYSVPALYFSVRDSTGQLVTDIDHVFALIVPEVYRTQIRDVGIMGGLSMANHPITDVPTFFIHPCQTADALREVAGERKASSREYILLWMGIIGGGVSLNAPLFLGVQQI